MNVMAKVLAGALMIVLGVYSSVTFWEPLVALVAGAIGPVLILVGAFIVWLETDEWKLQREKKEAKKQSDQGLQREFQPKDAVQNKESQPDYNDLLSGTVQEVKDGVREMDNPDYKAILKAEKNGKDRKTVKEFLERRID
jgi:hypothetical protein